MQGSAPQTVGALKRKPTITLLSGPIQTNPQIHSAGAVTGSSHRQLINNGSYVKFSAAPGEVLTECV